MFGQLKHRVRIAGALAAIAQLLQDEGQLERAAVLASFARNQAKQWGFSLRKNQEQTLLKLFERAQQVLGLERVALAKASGQSLNLDQALQLLHA